MQQKKIVFLASDCESSRWVFNALKKEFTFSAAIIETPVSKKTLFIRRIKKIGLLKVTGQALFSALVVPRLRKKAAARKEALVKNYGLDDTPFDSTITTRVPSVNDESCKALLQQLQPDIVVVNGTRIISRGILQCTNARFINMHVGITPAYRGSHGGYWAVYNNDKENFGTTIHFVDTGVDTGKIITQVFVAPAKEDNFTTYPVLQTAVALDALANAVKNTGADAFPGSSEKPSIKGKMYYQPTIWQYFLNPRK